MEMRYRITFSIKIPFFFFFGRSTMCEKPRAKLRHDEIWLVSKLPGFKSNKGYWFVPYIPVFIEEFLGSKVCSYLIYTTYWTRCSIKIKHCLLEVHGGSSFISNYALAQFFQNKLLKMLIRNSSGSYLGMLIQHLETSLTSTEQNWLPFRR